MEKSFLYFLILLLVSNGVLANETQKITLTGKVTDSETGEPLPGAEIYFPDLIRGTVTKEDGTFKIDNLPSIKLLIKVSMVGYAVISQEIDLSTIKEIEFKMKESVTEMKEVIITGVSTATEIMRNPIPVAVIDHAFLQNSSANNIIDVLAKVPGINAVSTGPNVSKPYIRGLGYNRVLTLYDGVRQDGQQWGDEHGIEVDQYSIDRVEVVKGPASLTYGSDALAGVINLLPANPIPVGTLRGELQSNFHTNNKQVGNSFYLEKHGKDIDITMRFSKKFASNYYNKYDGYVYGTKYDETNFSVRFGLYKSWGYSYLSFSIYNNRQEIPDGNRDSSSRKFVWFANESDTSAQIVSDADLRSYKIGIVHQRVQHYRIYSNSKFIFGKNKLSLKFGYQRSRREEFENLEFTNVAALSLQLNTFTYDAKWFLPEWKGVETTVGINGLFQSNSNPDATEFVIPDYHSFDFGPFLHLNKSYKKWEFSGGIRYDSRWFNNDSVFVKINPETGLEQQTDFIAGDTTITKVFSAYSHRFSGVSASVGFSYEFNDHFALKANVARGYRAPNIAEISAKGIHPGTGFLQLGDENLVPEFSLQEDIGLFFKGSHVSASIEIFNNNISHYIYNEKLESVNGGDSVFVQDGENFQVFRFRQTAAQLYGAEASIDIHPHPLDWLHLENSVSLVYAQNLGGNGAIINDSSKYLPFIPPLHTNTELRAEFEPKKGIFASYYFKFGVQYYAEQNRVFLTANTETITPAYVLMDAALGFDLRNKKNKTVLRFQFAVNNLADIAYQSNMSRLKYMDNYPTNGTGKSGIYNMGRNFSFKLSIPFGVNSKQ